MRRVRFSRLRLFARHCLWAVCNFQYQRGRVPRVHRTAGMLRSQLHFGSLYGAHMWHCKRFQRLRLRATSMSLSAICVGRIE
jgi:hypothetical protein